MLKAEAWTDDGAGGALRRPGDLLLESVTEVAFVRSAFWTRSRVETEKSWKGRMGVSLVSFHLKRED